LHLIKPRYLCWVVHVYAAYAAWLGREEEDFDLMWGLVTRDVGGRYFYSGGMGWDGIGGIWCMCEGGVGGGACMEIM
jgi:hypothetical protein